MYLFCILPNHTIRVEDSGLGGRESIIGAVTRGCEPTRGEPPGGKPNPFWSIGIETCVYDGSVWLRLKPAYEALAMRNLPTRPEHVDSEEKSVDGNDYAN